MTRKSKRRELRFTVNDLVVLILLYLNRTKIICDDENEIIFASPVLIITFSLGIKRARNERNEVKTYTRATAPATKINNNTQI